jgi:hypothetical protein
LPDGRSAIITADRQNNFSPLDISRSEVAGVTGYMKGPNGNMNIHRQKTHDLSQIASVNRIKIEIKYEERIIYQCDKFANSYGLLSVWRFFC